MATFDLRLPWQRRFDAWLSENRASVSKEMEPVFEKAFLTAWTCGEMHALDMAAARIGDVMKGRHLR
jgi:hypothetical protein